jgi:hypothetical protein
MLTFMVPMLPVDRRWNFIVLRGLWGAGSHWSFIAFDQEKTAGAGMQQAVFFGGAGLAIS